MIVVRYVNIEPRNFVLKFLYNFQMSYLIFDSHVHLDKITKRSKISIEDCLKTTTPKQEFVGCISNFIQPSNSWSMGPNYNKISNQMMLLKNDGRVGISIGK